MTEVHRDRGLLIRRVEFGTGLLLSLAVVSLHVVFMLHAGAFWRDEVNSINIATMPTISDLWSCLEYDSSPALSFLVFRFWSVLFGQSDMSFRVLGFVVGISLLGVLWISSLLMGRSVPLVSLSFLAIHPLTIRIGDSIRPYGLGILLIVLTSALIWKVVHEPARRWVIAATIAAVLSVQCMYHNAVLFMAVVFAGILTCSRDRRWKRVILLAAIAGFVGATLLPYRPVLRMAREWAVLLSWPVSFWWLVSVLVTSLSAPAKWMVGIWMAVVLYGLGKAVVLQRPHWSPQAQESQRDLALFCALGTIASITFLVAFYRYAQVSTQPWYYLPLMAMAALFMDAIVANANSERVLRIALVGLVAVFGFNFTWPIAHGRQTNMDLVAATLEDRAAGDDMIVMVPWFYGVSLHRYYGGEAPTVTLPSMEDTTIHRYDLLKRRMASADAIGPVLSDIAETLKSGRRVWIVGGLPLAEEVMNLPPAPQSKYGWCCFNYERDWAAQLMRFIESHSSEPVILHSLTAGRVNPNENVPVAMITGWRE